MRKKPLPPVCPGCGDLAEWDGDAIWCDRCNDFYWYELYGEVVTQEELAAIVFMLDQDDRLGVHLDRPTDLLAVPKTDDPDQERDR